MTPGTERPRVRARDARRGGPAPAARGVRARGGVTWKRRASPVVGLAGLALAGCAASPPLRIVPNEHEARTDLPGGIPEGKTLASRTGPRVPVVDRAPPPPYPEFPRYDEQPPGHVWVPGYWRWDGELRDHVWVPGGWMRPPRERAWIAPRWVETDDGRYRFLPGYWR